MLLIPRILYTLNQRKKKGEKLHLTSIKLLIDARLAFPFYVYIKIL